MRTMLTVVMQHSRSSSGQEIAAGASSIIPANENLAAGARRTTNSRYRLPRPSRGSRVLFVLATVVAMAAFVDVLLTNDCATTTIAPIKWMVAGTKR